MFCSCEYESTVLAYCFRGNETRDNVWGLEKVFQCLVRVLMCDEILLDVFLSLQTWIGNQNTHAKGKRKGGKHYKQLGKPRAVNGYNLFCSELSFPGM